MNAFMSSTIKDIRGGRESWRVLFVFSTIALAISIVGVVVPHSFF